MADSVYYKAKFTEALLRNQQADRVLSQRLDSTQIDADNIPGHPTDLGNIKGHPTDLSRSTSCRCCDGVALALLAALTDGQCCPARQAEGTGTV